MSKNQNPAEHATVPYPSIRVYGTRWKIMNILWKILLVTSLLWLCIGHWLISNQLETYMDHMRFRQSAQMMEATVIDRRVDEDQYRTFYTLTYQFSVEGYQQTFQKKEEVYDLMYEAYQEGKSIPIYYQPDDPSDSLLESMWNVQHWTKRDFAIFIAVLTWIPPLFLVAGWWVLFRRLPRKLRKHGIATVGTITECRDEPDRERHTIIFAFGVPQPSGPPLLISGQERFVRFPREFTYGDSLDIRYLPKKPTIFMLEKLTS
jgi:hypothetical protein